MMPDINEIEIRLVLHAIFECYGYDFRQYQQSTIRNRIMQYCRAEGHGSVAEMIPRLLHDKKYFYNLFLNLSVNVTEMFRYPVQYETIRYGAMSALKTYPFINVWHAGCATGEEAYSMAVLLKEEGMLHRAQIYATDINDQSLGIASKGIYSLRDWKTYNKNYHLAGGTRSLSDYYTVKYNRAKVSDELRKRITFSNHNLVSDGVFAEMHLIVCQNVLIYFNRSLQNRVLRLFADSLCHQGFLCLGERETLDFTAVSDQFELVYPKARIYRKKIII